MPEKKPEQKLSLGTVLILHALARGLSYGFDIMEETGLASGTVYPVLEKLERFGFVTSRWEDPNIAQREKRPPRRYYEITRDGWSALAVALEKHRSLAPVKFPRLSGQSLNGR